MRLSDYPGKEGHIFGGFIALGLIAYFWLAWLLGFVNVPELRLFNLFIQTAGIYLAYKQFKKNHEGTLHYFRAITIGFFASTIGTSVFALFLFVLFQFNNELFESIIKNEPLRPYLTVYLATIAVWTEGIVSGSMAIFLLTNVMDTDQP
jgi:Protein of unknown function (DUF4199)